MNLWNYIMKFSNTSSNLPVQPKILVLDIECAPSLVHVWKYWDTHVSPKMVLEHPHIMSFAAKWLNDPNIIYFENRKSDDKPIVEKLVYYLDEADIVVAHNGKKFDLPKIYGRALINGIKPPSPVKVVDTLMVARKKFGLPSNSLEYLCMVLGTSIKKTSHKKFPGHELWLECLRGNDEAWEEMKTYNIDDVLSLEEIYLKMLPWAEGHPNVSVYDNKDEVACPRCNSSDIQWRGYRHTDVGKYHRYQCNGCGSWSSSRYTLLSKNANLLKGI